MELEQWVAVAMSGVVTIALTVTLTAMVVDAVRRRWDVWSKEDYKKHEMLGRMEAIKEWQEAHGEDQKEEEK